MILGPSATMSGFSKIFGRKKEVVPSTQESLQKLRDTEEMLRKKQEFLEKKVETELLAAKKYGTANKRMALQALRRKQMCQKQLLQIDGVLNTLQHQQSSLENASVNAEVLQLAHNNMDIDDVHDLMEDIAEQQEVANEIAEAISNPVGLQLDDEDDLLAELEKLEEEDIEKQLLTVGPTPMDASKMPSVPTTELPSKSKAKAKEDDELGELAAWAES
ncbi:Charged multivesicular body protein 4b [Aphelenchoides fujianensis]|nr:Charged multivesicular body protein 4b [Aphelenchoides fujianensis]